MSETVTAGRRPATRTLLVNRVLVSAHAVAIIGQPVFAGGYLGGDYDMLWPHRWGADVASYLGLAQVLAGLVLWLAHGPRWVFWAGLLLSAGEGVQYVAGLGGALALHIPLGVALVTAAVLMTIAVWRPQVYR